MNEQTLTEKQPTLEGFVFLPNGAQEQRIITTPTFLTGALARNLFPIYAQIRKEKFKDNPNLTLQYDGQQITHSNIFDAVLIDEILRPFGAKTAMPYHLSDSEIMQAVKGKHYVDSRAVVLASTTDSLYPQNNKLAEKLAERVDLSKGNALMSGFKLESWEEDSKGYGLQLVPADDFAVIQDGRLAGKWNEYRFDEADEKGLPLHLDKKKGKRTWFTRDDGLSRFPLGGGLGLGSGWGRLGASAPDGRVVVVSAEGGAPENAKQE